MNLQTQGRYRLLGVSGSLRRGSYNTAILQSMADFGSQKAMLTIFPMNDIPPYDGDLDGIVPRPRWSRSSVQSMTAMVW